MTYIPIAERLPDQQEEQREKCAGAKRKRRHCDNGDKERQNKKKIHRLNCRRKKGIGNIIDKRKLKPDTTKII